MTGGAANAAVTVVAYVALGSNIGDRASYLRQAAERLGHFEQISVLDSSSIYETEPVGYVDQAAFLNQVIALRTSLPAHGLLQALMNVEQALGRKRDVRWGPRTIDLDLLLYGDADVDTPDLTVPHPRMNERAFVLIPLVDVMERTEPARAAAYRTRLEVAEGKEGVAAWNEPR